MKKIKVMIVDASAVIRQVLSDIIKTDPALEVDAAVIDPVFAIARMEMHLPDVIIMDAELPRMDGISFLKKIMSEHPIPVIMCSTLASKGSKAAMDALAAGAIDIIEKPKNLAKKKLLDDHDHIIYKIKTAAKARNLKHSEVIRDSHAPQKVFSENLTAEMLLNQTSAATDLVTDGIVAIGASTGGTQALEAVLKSLPSACPGIVIVQHMPEKFTKAFADRLNGICEVTVKEAQNNDPVVSGQALIAPGGKHMALKRTGSQYSVEVKAGPLVNRHRPSVDVLFHSVAEFSGKNALGIIMTGMGDDGAKGMLKMHEVGAKTIAQNETSCVVYGMPKVAVALGGVDEQLSLNFIAQKIMNFYIR